MHDKREPSIGLVDLYLFTFILTHFNEYSHDENRRSMFFGNNMSSVNFPAAKKQGSAWALS